MVSDWSDLFLTMILLDVSASKRFLLNVEVTPDLSHRPVARPSMRRRSGVQERMARCEDDILTDQSESVCPVRREKRSIFSQLGQWLCQASPDSLTATGMVPLILPTPTSVSCQIPPVFTTLLL